MNLLSDDENDGGCGSRGHLDAGDGVCDCGMVVYDIDRASQSGSADSPPSGVSV